MNSELIASPGVFSISGEVLSPSGHLKAGIDLRSPAPDCPGMLARLLAFFFPQTLTHTNYTRNVIADATVDLIDLGSTNASGQIRIYDDTRLTNIVNIPMDNPAFGSAINGVCIGQGLPISATAINTELAQEFDIVDRDDVIIMSGHVRVSGHELNLPDLEINFNDIVKILAMSYTATP